MIALIFLVVVGQVLADCPEYPTETRVLTGTARDVWGCSNQNLCGVYMAQGEPLPVCITNVSAWICAYDFEDPYLHANGDPGLILNTIDTAGRVPVLNPLTPVYTVRSSAQFPYWFRNVPNFNYPIPLNITISNAETCDSGVFQYQNTLFLPLKCRGFGCLPLLHTDDNWSFTYSLNMVFTYQGFEKYEFQGDDDVWVFINNLLAIDLGGLHPPQHVSVDLTYPAEGCPAGDLTAYLPCVKWTSYQAPGQPIYSPYPCACLLGLQKGVGYAFDLFFAERHSQGSNLIFSTSLLLDCPYYDHCGYCSGDGQSCCTCVAPDKCTTTKCNITSGACINTPVTCAAPIDKCHTNTCDKQNGTCVSKAITCNDFDPCTIDTCNGTIGCQFKRKDCADTNPCTEDLCNSSGQCVHNNISGCDARCSSLFCPVSDKCADRSCDPSTGECGNKLTICDDGNACTNDTCDPVNGCQYEPIVCDDQNPCTIDSCNSTSGCVFTPQVCNDNNLCTTDTCVNGTCTFAPLPLPTPNLCLGVYCDPTVGVIKTPTKCPLACQGECDPELGCQKCPGSRFGLVEKAAVGIGAGVVAAIVIGVVAFAVLATIGGKKGYDIYVKHKADMFGATTNPMYNDEGMRGQNPFYQDHPESFSEMKVKSSENIEMHE